MQPLAPGPLKWARIFDRLDIAWQHLPGTFAVYDRLQIVRGVANNENWRDEWLWTPDFRIRSTARRRLTLPICGGGENFMFAQAVGWGDEAWRRLLSGAAAMSSEGGCGTGPSVLLIPMFGSWQQETHTLVGLHMHKGDLVSFCVLCGGHLGFGSDPHNPEYVAADTGEIFGEVWRAVGRPVTCACVGSGSGS